MTHKFMKMAGVKNEKDFYKKYPTEDHFFAAFPHMMEKGGPIKNQWDLPSDPSTPGYEDYGDMYTVPQWPGLMYKDPGMSGWEGFGNPANLVTNQPAGDMGYGPVRDMPTRQLAMNPEDYSINELRASQMKDGGYSNPPGMYWNGTSYVKAKGTGTYANGAYFKDGGKFNYNPFIRKNGNYWTYLDYIEDGGNIAELKQGGPIGYVPASINAQPQILKQTDGVYHMQEGGEGPLRKIAVPPISRFQYVINQYPSLYQRYPGWTREDDIALDDRDIMFKTMAGKDPIQAGDYPINKKTLSPKYRKDYGIKNKPQFTEIVPEERAPDHGYKHGGPIEYIPAPMTVQPQILKRTNGVAHMKEGGIDNPGFRALPVAVQEKIKARMEFGGVHMPTPIKKDGGYWKYYGYDEDGGNIAELKEGGIHIKPSKRGTFTAAATKHGKSVQAFASQVLANKENYSPAMVKKANFARNAAKWKHEYGGPVDPMDEPMPQYAMGGHMNPFSAIAQFAYGGYTPMMQGGGEYAIGQYVEGKGYWDGSTFLSSPPGVTSNQISPEGSQAVMLNAPSSTTPTDAFKANSPYDTTVYNPQTDPNNPVNNPPPMPPQGGYAAAQGPVYEGRMEEQPQMIAGTEYSRKRPKLGPILGGLIGGITAGAGAISGAKRIIDARKNDINRGGSWNMASVQGSKGTMPNVNRMSGPGSVISQPGNFSPYRAQMGGMMTRNNMYQEGGVYDMDDAEIADLIAKGYKVQYV